MAEAAKTPKGAEETEKDQTARSAAPSPRNAKTEEDTFTLDELRNASQALFDVPGHVVTGAVHGTDLGSEGRQISKAEMKQAIEAFLQKEVK